MIDYLLQRSKKYMKNKQYISEVAEKQTNNKIEEKFRLPLLISKIFLFWERGNISRGWGVSSKIIYCWYNVTNRREKTKQK